MEPVDVAHQCNAGKDIACRTIRYVRRHHSDDLCSTYAAAQGGSTANAVDGDTIDNVGGIVLQICAHVTREEAQACPRNRGESQPAYLDPWLQVMIPLHEGNGCFRYVELTFLEDDRRRIRALIDIDGTVAWT